MVFALFFEVIVRYRSNHILYDHRKVSNIDTSARKMSFFVQLRWYLPTYTKQFTWFGMRWYYFVWIKQFSIKLKSREISFDHNLKFSSPIILIDILQKARQCQCCSLCKIQNDTTIDKNVGNEWKCVKIEFKMGFGQIYYFTTPRECYCTLFHRILNYLFNRSRFHMIMPS